MNNALAQLQAILFTNGAPISKKRLSVLIGCGDDRLEDLINELRDTCRDSGVTVLDDGSRVALATNPALREFIQHTRSEDQNAPLSKASQETLSIIAYAGPIAKVDLDFLRGVNTQYTVRRLAVRGLIQEQKEGGKKMLVVTVDFLSHLGLQKTKDLPDYKTVRRDILEGLRATKKKMEE